MIATMAVYAGQEGREITEEGVFLMENLLLTEILI